MLLKVENKSTLLTDADVALMVAAVQAQLNEDYSPAWGMVPIALVFDGSKAPDYFQGEPAWSCVFVDDEAQASNALAYHTEAADLPEAIILVARSIKIGKFTASGVATDFSHEILELSGNPYTNAYRVMPDLVTDQAQEIADPVQDGSYPKTAQGQKVYVSNFVTPAYFDWEADKGSAKFDFLGVLQESFSIAPGGYAIRRSGGGLPSEVFGASCSKVNASMFSRRERLKRAAVTP